MDRLVCSHGIYQLLSKHWPVFTKACNDHASILSVQQLGIFSVDDFYSLANQEPSVFDTVVLYEGQFKTPEITSEYGELSWVQSLSLKTIMLYQSITQRFSSVIETLIQVVEIFTVVAAKLQGQGKARILMMAKEYISLIRVLMQMEEQGSSGRLKREAVFCVAKIFYLSYTGNNGISWPVNKALEFLIKSSMV